MSGGAAAMRHAVAAILALVFLVAVFVVEYRDTHWTPSATAIEQGNAKAIELTRKVELTEKRIREKYGKYSFDPAEYSFLGTGENWDSLIVGWNAEESKLVDAYRLEAVFSVPIQGGYGDYYCTLTKTVNRTTSKCTFDGAHKSP